mmetsp:Transcript_29398/g.50777  ORF Transcript_29398/g.50777 Transcript_29398/m.50777 type:complete len:266 (+) Transcript_29398:124-921(+)
MPQYGVESYWDNRYGNDFPEPFDWLFSYKDLKFLLSLMIKKSDRILIIGCGNADLSIDMYNDGYQNQVNMDYCEVVINQQRERHPHLDWQVSDVRSMPEYGDSAFDVVLDKSLIDTMMCYDDAAAAVGAMAREVARVLRPGGRYLALSLHRPRSGLAHLRQDHLHLEMHYGYLLNPKYDADKHKNRATAFSVLVGDYHPDGLPDDYTPPPLAECTLNERQLRAVKEERSGQSVAKLLAEADVGALAASLARALAHYAEEQGWEVD